MIPIALKGTLAQLLILKLSNVFNGIILSK